MTDVNPKLVYVFGNLIKNPNYFTVNLNKVLVKDEMFYIFVITDRDATLSSPLCRTIFRCI